MSELDELRALLARATPRPWTALVEDGLIRLPDDQTIYLDIENCEADAALIAAAVNALPALLDVATEARTLMRGIQPDDVMDWSTVAALRSALARLEDNR